MPSREAYSRTTLSHERRYFAPCLATTLLPHLVSALYRRCTLVFILNMNTSVVTTVRTTLRLHHSSCAGLSTTSSGQLRFNPVRIRQRLRVHSPLSSSPSSPSFPPLIPLLTRPRSGSRHHSFVALAPSPAHPFYSLRSTCSAPFSLLPTVLCSAPLCTRSALSRVVSRSISFQVLLGMGYHNSGAVDCQKIRAYLSFYRALTTDTCSGWEVAAAAQAELVAAGRREAEHVAEIKKLKKKLLVRREADKRTKRMHDCTY